MLSASVWPGAWYLISTWMVPFSISERISSAVSSFKWSPYASEPVPRAAPKGSSAWKTCVSFCSVYLAFFIIFLSKLLLCYAIYVTKLTAYTQDVCSAKQSCRVKRYTNYRLRHTSYRSLKETHRSIGREEPSGPKINTTQVQTRKTGEEFAWLIRKGLPAA